MDDVRAVGRMFMVGVRGAAAGDGSLESDLDACAAAGIGGVVLFDRDVDSGGVRNVRDRAQVAALIGHVRARLGDVVVAVDQEGGRVARFRAEHGFSATPSARDFARLGEGERERVAREMAEQLAGVGVDVNFAPCVDVGEGCPVIGGLGRNFGSDAETVIACAGAVLDAHERAGVMACLKHFPGHGSAAIDSHAGLPDVTGSFDDALELAPYRALVGRAPAVMTGHVLHRDYDAEHPASVSRAVTTGMLREGLGFDGLVVTDSLDMGALRVRWGLEECAAMAVRAGADVLLHACNSALGETAAEVAAAVRALARDEEIVALARESAARLARSARERG